MRGCQKKIVYFKNTGSKIFDEAYFVISDRSDDKKAVSADMIAEAQRIISECCVTENGRSKTYFRKRGSFRPGVLLFSLGALLSAVISAVILMIII